MRRYKTGLLIGRFQPFHKGHLHLIKRSLHYVDKLIIGIGTANRIDQQNPLKIETRKNILRKVLTYEKLNKRIKKIISIDDYLESDDLWLREALKKVGRFDVLIGNDDWTDNIFERANYTVLRLGFYKRQLYEGTKIRKLQKNKKEWSSRVPHYLVKYLHKKI
jgi:nicotinamide-nucleotide adenylyltransferase